MTTVLIESEASLKPIEKGLKFLIKELTQEVQQ